MEIQTYQLEDTSSNHSEDIEHILGKHSSAINFLIRPLSFEDEGLIELLSKGKRYVLVPKKDVSVQLCTVDGRELIPYGTRVTEASSAAVLKDNISIYDEVRLKRPALTQINEFLFPIDDKDIKLETMSRTAANGNVPFNMK